MNQLGQIGELFRSVAELPADAELTDETEAERYAAYAEDGLRVETTYALDPSEEGLALVVQDFKQKMAEFGSKSKRLAVNRLFLSWPTLVERIDESMASAGLRPRRLGPTPKKKRRTTPWRGSTWRCARGCQACLAFAKAK